MCWENIVNKKNLSQYSDDPIILLSVYSQYNSILLLYFVMIFSKYEQTQKPTVIIIAIHIFTPFGLNIHLLRDNVFGTLTLKYKLKINKLNSILKLTTSGNNIT